MAIRFNKPSASQRRDLQSRELDQGTKAAQDKTSSTSTEATPSDPTVQAGEASPEMKVALGDAGGAPTRRKKSAGSQGALAGLNKAASDEEQQKSGTPRWKKAVLGAMMGLTLFNAMAAPAMADTLPVDPPTQMEQVVDAQAGGFTNPLMLQLAEKSDGTLVLPSSALGGGVTQAADLDDPGTAPGPLDEASNASTSKLSLDEVDDDVRLPDLGGGGTLDPGVQDVVDTATERLESKLADILNLDASSLASGQTPFQNGDGLSDLQQTQLQDAFGDFFKDLPAGALDDALTGPLKAALEAGGVDVSNFDQTPIGDLGDLGGELAENLLEKFKDDHPAAFYATAGALAAGVATYGYLEGSEALRDLGIKPEVSTDLFNDRVEVKLGADWDAKFENPRGSLDTEFKLGGGHTAGAGVGYDGEDFSPRLSYRFDGDKVDLSIAGEYDLGSADVDATGSIRWQPDDDLSLSLQGKYDADGADHLSLTGRHTLDNGSTLDVGVRNVWDGDNDHTDVTARWRLSEDNVSVSAGASYRFGNDDGFGADLSIGYQPQDNIDLQLRGGVNPDGDAHIGVGFTWRF